LSPVIEFIADLIASGLGGTKTTLRTPFPEGEGNASLGAVATFAGVLAAIFALALLLITAYGSGLSMRDYASLIAASLVVACLAFGGRWAGLRAPNVTRRNLGLAGFGRGVATLALATSVAAALVGTIQLIRHAV
jgi:hypothetical protein